MDDTTQTQELQNESAVIRRAGRQAVLAFLESHSIFGSLRNSGKVVVFDTRIPIQLAFYALVEHDMLAAPLWDAKRCQFVGLLTVTDFIDLLLDFSAPSHHSDVSALATTSIGTIRKSFSTFQGVDSECNLKIACQLLLQHGCDFLPIVFPDDMRVLAVLSYTDILEHLVTHFREQRRLFDDTVMDLGIGTYQDLKTIAPTNTLAQALLKMKEHNLSALPVVDPTSNKVIGMYSRSDITFLTKATDAEDALRNLDLKISDIMATVRHDVNTPDNLRTCHKSHTLQAIFESFASLKFNRLVVVNDADVLVGIVSARDLVQYFLRDETVV